MTTPICPRCRKPTTVIVMTLYQGKNGYRRYPLCEKCSEAVKAAPKAQTKVVARP
jgi:hypothetical protein